MFKFRRHSLTFRFTVSILGLLAIALGTAPMLRHGLFYKNWFGGMVFALIAIVFEAFLIFCAIFKPDWLK